MLEAIPRSCESVTHVTIRIVRKYAKILISPFLKLRREGHHDPKKFADCTDERQRRYGGS
jgi:hypothetical protein